ncbi:MAG: glycosyltransferase [Sciscionella sp.]
MLAPVIDLVTPMAVRTAATLHLADLMTDGSVPVDELARLSGSDPDALGRLLQQRVCRGVFTELSLAMRMSLSATRSTSVPRWQLSFRAASDPLPATAHHIRPSVLDLPAGYAQPDVTTAGALRWLAARSDRPTVYFTLGTVFHQESGDLFSRVLEGLGALHANIIVTVGREARRQTHASKTSFRRNPFSPTVMSSCRHAGSGSVVGALAFAVPLVLLPIGADQPLNADRCAALGVSCVLDPVTAGPDGICCVVADVLRAPTYREAAVRIRDKIHRLPASKYAATSSEALATPARS